MNEFKLKAPYEPTGDQPQAIAELVKGFKEGNQCQTLLGVTGSGKPLHVLLFFHERSVPEAESLYVLLTASDGLPSDLRSAY